MPLPAMALHHKSHDFHVNPTGVPETPEPGEWIIVQAKVWATVIPVCVKARRADLSDFIARNPRLKITVIIQNQHVLGYPDDRQRLLLEIANG